MYLAAVYKILLRFSPCSKDLLPYLWFKERPVKILTDLDQSIDESDPPLSEGGQGCSEGRFLLLEGRNFKNKVASKGLRSPRYGASNRMKLCRRVQHT